LQIVKEICAIGILQVIQTYSQGGATVSDYGSGCRAHTSTLAWLSCFALCG